MFNKNNENYIYEIIARNLKKYRKQANLTQDELSLKCNYSKSFISNIESIKTHQTVSLGTLYKFAKTLNIPVYYLLVDEENKD